MHYINEKKYILKIQNKSFLRKKWETTLNDIIVKRIPKVFISKNEIIFINNEKQINDLINTSNSEKNKKVIKRRGKIWIK